MEAIGGYQLLGRVSENRPVSVWKGRHPASAREVAVKQVELTSNLSITRLRVQMRLLSGISHPSIVEVLDLIEEQGRVWLVEDWVEGASVAEIVETRAFSAEQAVAIVSDALAGLAHLHDRAIIHGNVTSASLLLDHSGATRLTDFGVAGDPSGPVTPQSDIRAVAAVLEGLVSQRPANIAEVLSAAQSTDPGRGFANAGDLRRALDEAATIDFGPGWRDRVELRRGDSPALEVETVGSAAAQSTSLPVLLAAAPESTAAMPALPASAPTNDGPTAHRVKVRSTKRTPRAADPSVDVREYLDPRSGNRANDVSAGKVIPIAATVVVIAAIIVLLLTHHDTNKTTTAGLAFRGSYSVTTTLRSAGIGSDQGQPVGTVHTEQWQVTPTCASSGSCTASITSSEGVAFALVYADGAWTGERAVTSTGGCVNADSFTLSSASSSVDTKLTGTVLVVAGGCGQPGSEAASVVLTRIKSS